MTNSVRIADLELGEHDKIVILSERPLRPEVVERLKKEWEQALASKNQIIFLDAGLSLTVVRREAP